VATVVLKNHVVLLYGRVVKVFERVLVPNDIHVLEEYIESQHGNQLDGNDLGHHHGNKFAIAVMGRRFDGSVAKVLKLAKSKQRTRVQNSKCW
jgi:hypothetical protein